MSIDASTFSAGRETYDAPAFDHSTRGNGATTRTWISQILPSQLAQGAELTKEDLQGLQALLHSDCNNTSNLLTPLTRTLLDQHSSSSSSSPLRLVRHFGMVQDMMDPEYYVSEVQGQSMHFRDPPIAAAGGGAPFEDDPEGELFSAQQHLAERQPLLVVPVPYSSEWFVTQNRMKPQESSGGGGDDDMAASSIVIPESPPAQQQQPDGSRKRDRDEEASMLALGSNVKAKVTGTSKNESSTTTPPRHNMECEDPTSTTSPASEAGGGVHGQESDWWPAGSLESPVNECPVLAKFYYDQYPPTSSRYGKDNKLQLNDLVETIGILSMDPWEADFSSSTTPIDDFGTISPPPPSRLPRLHVLSFRRIDLDGIVAARQQNESSSSLSMVSNELHYHDEQPSLTQEELPPSLGGSNGGLCRNPLEAWAHHCLSLDSTALAETLFLTLVAKAERKQGEIQRGPEHALGCASLQLVCPSDRAADRLYQQLHQFLHQVCPVMAGMDLTHTTYSSSTTTTADRLPLGIVSLPSKESGRLWANPWQLPPGATLLIRAPNAWNQHPTVRPILEELCAQHHLAYKFEGGMKVPFDADYRIIVVSSSSSYLQNTIPCTLQLKMNDMVAAEDAETTTMFPTSTEILQELRRALAQGRSHTGGTSNGTTTDSNVGLPPSVLEQAQQDFLHRRGHARRSQESSSSLTTPTTTAMPEEADFHRWLTLTRLYARARGASTATTADWESALGLDDTIRVSYS